MTLSVRELEVSRGSLRVLRGVSFDLWPRDIVGLVGENGAGKSTLLAALVGLLPSRGGEVRLGERRVEGLGPRRLLRLGVALVPQGRRVFPGLTVRQNLELGGFVRRRGTNIGAEAEKFLARYPIIARRADQPAGTLSGGEQALVVLGRALLSRPRVLLLDEPLMGLAGSAAGQVLDQIAELAETGVAVLVVEHKRAAMATVTTRTLAVQDGRVEVDVT